jgi:hypothetical protein
MRHVTTFAVTALLTLAGCAGVPAYEQSITSTAVYRETNVAPLQPLAWPVHAATLTNRWEWWESNRGRTVATGDWDTWITVEGEVQRICRAFPRDRVVDRLNQLLGLKPATDTDRASARFVRLTIAAPQPTGPTGQGIFRPCADPDPSATACGNTLKGKPDYAVWFAGQFLGSYRVGATPQASGYPWSRLGYTWNWDPEAANPRGAQEYVVPPRTTVTIEDVVSPADYCAKVPD